MAHSLSPNMHFQQDRVYRHVQNSHYKSWTYHSIKRHVVELQDDVNVK